MNTEESRKINETKPEDVKPNDLMCFSYWGIVKFTNERGNNVHVKDVTNGQDFNVYGVSLVRSALSADQCQEVIKVTKTKAAELLSSSFHVPLTVCFDKQDGKERILRGRLLSTEPLLGRSYVEDLDIQGDSKKRMRLVDHRTIKWLVVQGTKYVVNQ